MEARMREIKFRAWNNDKNEWLDKEDCKYLTIHLDGSYEINLGWVTIFPHLTIEQYTGLKDKNGKEIYEGDIMRYDAIDYKVLWADYYAGFETKRLNSPWNNAGLTLHFLASVGRVIGNIHENPELLGGKE